MHKRCRLRGKWKVQVHAIIYRTSEVSISVCFYSFCPNSKEWKSQNKRARKHEKNQVREALQLSNTTQTVQTWREERRIQPVITLHLTPNLYQTFSIVPPPLICRASSAVQKRKTGTFTPHCSPSKQQIERPVSPHCFGQSSLLRFEHKGKSLLAHWWLIHASVLVRQRIAVFILLLAVAVHVHECASPPSTLNKVHLLWLCFRKPICPF